MKRILLITVLVMMIHSIKGQDAKGFADQICDSVQKLEASDPYYMKLLQLEIHMKVLTDTLPKILIQYKDNYQNRVNIFNYNLIRELNRNCPENLIKYPVLMPSTAVLDLDSAFNPTQLNTLHFTITRLKEEKKMQILVLETDDLFPFETLDDYAGTMLNEWNIGADSDKGGILFVFSKTSGDYRMVLTKTAQKRLKDSECQVIRERIIDPKFKAGLYFEGIYDLLTELQKMK